MLTHGIGLIEIAMYKNKIIICTNFFSHLHIEKNITWDLDQSIQELLAEQPGTITFGSIIEVDKKLCIRNV
ncbi:hypothetical protein A3F66_06685 [candidate division TM6 bacterium RIFCSPHIGHO2_12_FULL_32_22]|nr:MAG: hypothetical protein A3F66_06685 [candidate division TM6 bacterium RIFCSPHIGHO2_12_FULL_32_22]